MQQHNRKYIVLVAGIGLVLVAFGTGRTGGSPVREDESNAQAARSATIDAHKSVTYHFAVTNTTDKAQTVESIRTSCACLKVVGSRVPRDREGRAVSTKPPIAAASSMPPYQAPPC